jgi:pantoate--beta-alanine ligase
VAIIRAPAQVEPFRGGTFVPTMGALHKGHLALVRHAAALGRPVVVSVFVNPTQFGPGEDFDRYPRNLETDAALAEAAGADVVFAPDAEAVYPSAAPVPVPRLPEVATRPGLEDARRPNHFAGVCQVVARLFDLVRPRRAVFGEKDYQQLLVIEALVLAERPRWGDLAIARHATVRDEDGLALSSRNAFLGAAQRARALALVRALRAAQLAPDARAAEESMRHVIAAHGLDLDYAVVRDAGTLMPVESFGTRPARALVAARLGQVRLIDNMAMGEGGAA